MPTYEYECDSCGHKFEVFQSMLDKPLKKCPECGKRVRRLFGTGAGILFKGSGFYETDYRSDGYKAAAKKETSPDSTDSGSSDNKKTETKKTETKKAETSSQKETVSKKT